MNKSQANYINIKGCNGRSFNVSYHLNQWLCDDFINGQYGLNIESKFFKTFNGAVNYGVKSITNYR